MFWVKNTSWNKNRENKGTLGIDMAICGKFSLYYLDNKSFIVYPEDGTLKTVSLPSTISPKKIAGAEDGTLAMISHDKKLCILDARGNLETTDSLEVVDVCIGSSNKIYVLNTENLIYYYVGENRFLKYNDHGNFKKISCANDGTLIGIGMNNYLYRLYIWQGTAIHKAISKNVEFTDVSVASSSDLIGISNNKVQRYKGEGIFEEIDLMSYEMSPQGDWTGTAITGTVDKISYNSYGECVILVKVNGNQSVVYQLIEEVPDNKIFYNIRKKLKNK